ncbi:uncharacterized protein SPAPADRAFT_69449 [Spathaspora passalidarum NRRL Y-27907]|uniref:NADH:flavin oxidoreductase/NADH oxidase N-terminal domain-containing protein n=1 Tax=Spathaspora passalidarum (strain NRRL Y-27907 / 11-Y1) TaxID=619300 RepID=G3AFY0_SPAPN|nr:uncharacterized protein SPAPADRAFT_69449 [Spathaspora passalidarum NRRL Y-27907]EGW35118.1 hypothetical protein SPAPADRAFT_69449 [Spathaspora passalidarum NRRL Y-27907]
MTIVREVKPSDDAKPSNVVSYYTPEQPIPAGTFIPPEDNPNQQPPGLFKPIQIGNMTIQNRVGVSPMCIFSADSQFEATPFHLVHYGSIAVRGPGIVIVESTAVSPEGGLSPHDLGLWNDNQAEKLRPIVDFIHSQSQKCAIQLCHAGRKASGQPLFLHLEQLADESVGGWPESVVGPSPIEFRPNGNLVRPRELTTSEIKRIVQDFGKAAKRAVDIGFDAVEIHGAHGYLINQFCSELSNQRTDEYGGSFENRIRFALEVIDEVKKSINNESIPIFLSVCASDNSLDKKGWVVEDTMKLVDHVIGHGVQLLDISSGGNCYNSISRSRLNDDHTLPPHVEIARKVKRHVGNKAVVACVGKLERDPVFTNKCIEDGDFDLALIGTPFLKNPGTVWNIADQLGVRWMRYRFSLS